MQNSGSGGMVCFGFYPQSVETQSLILVTHPGGTITIQLYCTKSKVSLAASIAIAQFVKAENTFLMHIS